MDIIKLVNMISILLMLNGCSWASTSIPSPSQEQKMPLTTVTYESLLSGMEFTGWYPTENLKETYAILNDKNDIHASFPDVSSVDTISQPFPPKELDQIDYCSEFAVILTPGHEQSGTHRITVDQLEVSENKLIIRITKTSYTEKSTQALTFPFTLLKVSREQLPQGNIEVIFIDQYQQVTQNILFQNGCGGSK